MAQKYWAKYISITIIFHLSDFYWILPHIEVSIRIFLKLRIVRSWWSSTLWISWIFEYYIHAIFFKNNFAIGVGSIRVVCQITPWDDFWYFTTRRVWGIEDEIQKWFSKNIFCYSANTANMTFCFLLQCFVYEMSSKTITCTDVVMLLCFLIR